MKATFTNLGTVPVPLTSTQGKGFAASLDPGLPYILDAADVTDVTIGDNPEFTEDLKKALGDVFALAIKLLTFWREQPVPQGATGVPEVRVRIVAAEGNSLRVTGDDKNLDHEVVPGSTYDAVMKDYVQVLQLGLAQQNINMQQAP